MAASELRRRALVAGVHVALLGAVWLTASALYAVVFAGGTRWAWLAIDAVLVAAAIAFVARQREHVGFRALGHQRLVAIAGTAAFALGCVAVSQAVIDDGMGVWLDESEYLATLREGRIRDDGLFPFNLRWLAPILAGPCNVLPVADADALKALNFGALVVTAMLVVLLLLRIGVRRSLALAAPVLLLSSYLGVYAAQNRLVIDPVNYALFAVLAHALLRRAHWPYFALALVVTACNSEKAVYWVPVLAALALGHAEARSLRRRLLVAARDVVVYCGPALAYLVAIRLYLAGSPSETQVFAGKLRIMAFTALGSRTLETGETFPQLWFPFGAFTVYALLGLRDAVRPIQLLVLLLVPILASTLVATDTERMVAYAFIVYLPLGLVYLTRAYAELPLAFARALLVATIALAIAQHYLLPVARALGDNVLAGNPARVRLALAAIELVVVGATVVVHQTVYAARSRG